MLQLARLFAACVEPAEKALAEAVLALRTEVQPLIAKGDYTAVLDKISELTRTGRQFL